MQPAIRVLKVLHQTKASCVRLQRPYSNRNILKLQNRGLFHDIFPESSNEILDLLNAGPQCVYAGFDPTASSLHIGNLLVLINLLHWQRAGHQAVALIGGATAQIGDPSGRSTERPELAMKLVESNSNSIKDSIQQIFRNHENVIWKNKEASEILPPICIINNLEWYSGINLVEFVGKIGRHFRMGTMLSRQSVQSRLNSAAGMNFTEFTYQIFQAYDWLHLCKNYNCRFQIGGSDQMGNMVSGHDLISRMLDTQVYGITVPLVTSEGGDKLGKSAGNAVWLSSQKTSPFELYQFFVRVKDSDVEKLLKLYTFLSLPVIQEIMRKHKESPESRFAQRKLAKQITLLVHGEEGLRTAKLATSALYEGSLESLAQLPAADVGHLFQGAAVSQQLLHPGTTSLQVALHTGCFANESDARRIISAGGFYMNHQRITNADEVLTQGVHILPNNITLLRVGKKNYYVIKWMK